MLTSFFHSRLRHYVKQYLAAHPEIKLVVVAGSIGKASTKHAIGTVLSQSLRVRMHDESVIQPVDVDLAILGIEMPAGQRRLSDWWRAMRAARYQIKHPAAVDVIVQELVIDRPGGIAYYGKYLRPNIAVVTAVTDENMNTFGTLDAVAAEELSVANIAEYVLINRDDVAGRFANLEQNANFSTYGSAGAAEYRLELDDLDQVSDAPAQLIAPELSTARDIHVQIVGEHAARPLAAAAATAFKLGLPHDAIVKGIENVTPLPGRLQPLRGLDGTVVLDDTWSIDPDSLVADLQTLYQFESASKRIAVVGSMNLLGTDTEAAYQVVGDACNASLLAWLVIVGETSAHYLAPIARRRGCQVKVCRDAIEAAEFTRSVSETGAVILVKGSVDDALEETVKVLVDIGEYPKLVRQTADWRAKKATIFSRFVDTEKR